MLKYLVSIDGTDNSLPAVRHVARLKKENVPLSVMLVYVHYEPTPYGAVTGGVTPERIRVLEREMADEVFAQAEAMLREAGVDFTRQFRVAEDVAREIANVARESGCDAIVMGTHPGRPLAKAVMGSTAIKAIQLAEVPVTIVREREAEAA
jgi:nucleotide-binding universal stress UspA family protein